MQKWWRDLNQREQRVVLIMSFVVAVFLFITLVWQPLNENLEKAEVQVVKQQKLALWVKQNVVNYKKLKRSGGKQSSESLSSMINRTAKKLSITVARMQPQGDDLQVWVDEVPFDDFLNWMEQITAQEKAIIVAVDVALADKPGTVKIRRLQVAKG